jgi:hypothetical protein
VATVMIGPMLARPVASLPWPTATPGGSIFEPK